jgi:hypothetical protein
MKHCDEISKLLQHIEAEIGKIPYVVSAQQKGVGDVQINVYPTKGDADVRIFSLHQGLTPTVERRIRDWFEPLAQAEVP